MKRLTFTKQRKLTFLYENVYDFSDTSNLGHCD